MIKFTIEAETVADLMQQLQLMLPAVSDTPPTEAKPARRKPAEAKVEPEPAATVVETKKPSPFDEDDKPAAPTHTKDDVIAAAHRFLQKFSVEDEGNDAFLKILDTFGVAKIGALDPSTYGDVIAAIDKG